MDIKDNFKKGAVEILILKVLSEQDMYGYELSQIISERSNEVISIPEGSMYPTLYKLEDSGYITGEKRLVGKRRTRIYYHIQPKGKEYLEFVMKEYYKMNEAIYNVLDWKKDK